MTENMKEYGNIDNRAMGILFITYGKDFSKDLYFSSTGECRSECMYMSDCTGVTVTKIEDMDYKCEMSYVTTVEDLLESTESPSATYIKGMN